MTAPDDCYHAGMRGLQDRFDTHRLADRLAERLSRERFTEEDRAFIESRTMFFLATADADGFPDCSYKGGDPGFVRLLDDATLAFPSYDGNGMFRSLGNIAVNPPVGLLFIDWERPRRLRVSGEAKLLEPDAMFPGAQIVVHVRARLIFPNCPRYIHRLAEVERSEYVPRAGLEAPVPAWKRFEMFADVLPANDPARGPMTKPGA
jgi:predicted pyridoxine 5'-phosphate oxidase superfamily flavin-nucleotide-binding protein